MEKIRAKTFNRFINEKTEQVYPTNFKIMVHSALSSIYTSIMAIAQEIANEKAVRNPKRYDGTIQEIDITRAMNLIFHSDWKKKIKNKCLDQVLKSSIDRAEKMDNVVLQKNQRAIARSMGDKDFNINIDKSQIRFSDEKSSMGPGSNQ